MTDTTSHRRKSRWALAALLKALRSRWAQGWAKVPDGGGRRWFWTVFWGTLLINALSAALVLITRRLDAAGKLAWEDDFVLWTAKELPLSYYQGTEIGTPGSSLWLWPLMILGAGMAIWMLRPLRALSLVAGYALVSVSVVFGWSLWDRPRPEFIHGGIAAPDFNSFPSGHAAHALLAYGLLAWFWTQKSRSALEKILAATLVLGMVVMISAGRLRIGAHWPTDIMAGTILGAAWLLVLILALRRGEQV